MSLLRELEGHPEYVGLLKKAEKLRPIAPNWHVDTVTGKDNADEWRRLSAMQDGFDLCLQVFRPK